MQLVVPPPPRWSFEQLVCFISVHCALVFQMHPGDPAPPADRCPYPHLWAHRAEVLINTPPHPPAVWRNMAPLRPTRTARLCPLNTRLPPSRSITVKYDSLEVDTVLVAPAPSRSCNAGHGGCFTLQQRSPWIAFGL